MRRLTIPVILASSILLSSCIGPFRIQPRTEPCPPCEKETIVVREPAPEPKPCPTVPAVAEDPAVEKPAPPAPKCPEPAPEKQAVVTPGVCNPGDALVNATLWVQTAAEYRAAAIQTFAAARLAIDAGLADRNWVAATEETSDGESQSPAVIVDVDETVIDNTRFQARVIAEGKTYDGEIWDQWTAESGAAAVPGAAEFLAYARNKGVKVFYISNRTIDEEQETLRNLQRLGYPVDNDPDTLLMRAERTAWASGDKTMRREYAASSHRILAIVGDDLNDFTDAREKGIGERDEIVARTRAWWGTRWFIVPNPMYGSWERSATGGTGNPCEQLRKKVETLRQ